MEARSSVSGRMMEVRRIHATPAVVLSAISCRPEMMGQSPVEYAAYSSIVFVRRGSYRMHHQGQQALIDPHALLFFRAGCEYSVSHPLCCGDDCIEFAYGEEMIAEFESEQLPRNDCPRSACGITLRRAAPSVIRNQAVLARKAQCGCASDLEVEDMSFALLRLAIGARDPHVSADSAANRKVEMAKSLLLADPAKKWTLNGIAREISTSPFHLTRLFRQQTGTPLHRFLLRTRLAIALDRILQGDDDLTRLALDLGFSSHSHFSAAFRRAFGTTPSATRAATGGRGMRAFRRSSRR